MLIKWIIKFFKKAKSPQLDKKPTVVKVKSFRINKHYDDMTRNQRREYARWLHKHKLWDGAMVVDNIEKINKSRYGKNI